MKKQPGGNRFAMQDVTADDLQRMYHVELLSQWQIAEKLGVTQGAVFYWFRKHGIKSRSHDDSLIVLGKSGRFTGDKNPRWTGGKHTAKSGYVFVRMPTHPKACKRGYVREHVLVWEKAHKKSLPKGWHVHHKNGIKDDNRPENLEAMSWQQHRDLIPSLLRRIAELEAKIEEMKNGTG